jgi:hypothetical protein
MRPARGQDKEAGPAVCLVSRWEERRSKQARSGIAIPSRAAARRAIVPAAIAVGLRFAHSVKPEHSEQGRVAPP